MQYEENENAVVNTEPTVSETPSNLVADDEAGKLSPNPAGFGFTKQVTVNTLSSPGSPDTLYLVPQYDGEGHVKEYYKYRWDVAAFAFKRIFEPVNNVKFEEGEHAIPIVENTAPKTAPEKVFTGEVVFNQEPTIEGKKLHDWVDSEGGVTQEELNAALGNYYKKTETYDRTQIDNKLAAKQDNLIPEDVPDGVVNKVFGFNPNGDIVKDDLPEGIVVDDSLDTESDNAIANKPVAEKFAQVDEDLETKANVDGNYPTMTVGVADQLSPYDDESGDDQDEPFSFQATGTGNGTQPDFATGSIALLKEKQGNSVVVNQLAKAVSSSNWGIYGATGSITDGVLSMTATEQFGRCVQVNTPVIANHKYFMSCDIYLTSDTNDVSLNLYYADKALKPLTSGWHHLQDIVTVSTSGDVDFRVIDSRDSGWDEIKAKNIILVDLTQWFNGDIPADLLSHPDNFFRYYQGSLAYNTGTLVNANSRYVKCIGRNQWDEVFGVAFDGRYGSVNFIRVNPNTKYVFREPSVQLYGMAGYDKDKNLIGGLDLTYRSDLGTGCYLFTIPANCLYIKFNMGSGYGNTYKNDITISLYYEDESGYDQYYPYEILTNNDTGTETLRSAGNIADIKKPDGSIVRNVGYVDLGTLDYIYVGSVSGDEHFETTLSGVKLPSSNTSKANLLCTKLVCKASNDIYMHAGGDKVIALSTLGTIYIVDTSYNDAAAFKTAMSGVYLFYELATPTTEQGTPYSENIVIDDFGSMDFSGTNGVPQGNLIFYPVDYKAFIDTLYDYTEGTPSNIALKSDLPTAPQTWAESLPGYDATKTQTLKNVEGTLTWVDDE